MPQVDPELEAALRRLRAAFGFVEVVEVIDHRADQSATPSDAAGQEGSDDQPSPEP